MEDNVFSFIHHGKLTVRGPKEAMRQIVVVLNDDGDEPIEVKMSEESMPLSVQRDIRARIKDTREVLNEVFDEIEAERSTAEAAPTTSAST